MTVHRDGFYSSYRQSHTGRFTVSTCRQIDTGSHTEVDFTVHTGTPRQADITVNRGRLYSPCRQSHSGTPAVPKCGQVDTGSHMKVYSTHR